MTMYSILVTEMINEKLLVLSSRSFVGKIKYKTVISWLHELVEKNGEIH